VFGGYMVNFKALSQAQQLAEKLALDITQRQGVHSWWEDIKPEVKEGIKREVATDYLQRDYERHGLTVNSK
jgi:hypothetical protein